MRFVRLPEWGLAWLGDARYYGWHWCAHVGPWLILIWQCSEADMEQYWHDMGWDADKGRQMRPAPLRNEN